MRGRHLASSLAATNFAFGRGHDLRPYAGVFRVLADRRCRICRCLRLVQSPH
jgi:hypothetical protein